MKKLLIGNGAVARGLYEAGCSFVSSYPGTPSTEITEFAATYPEVYAEWAPNEKVAVESAIGASIAGARAFSAMKHVGLNVAADPVFTASYSGVNGGLVIAVADDPGMHSSQNEQDSRHYARAGKIPMLEPSSSVECIEFTKAAFELSELFDVPVFIRLSTRIAHSQSLVEEQPRVEAECNPAARDARKYVMTPGNARARRAAVEQREKALREWAENTPLNRIERGGRIGVITAGDCVRYAREALGDSASYLVLGAVYPLPEKLIREFAASVDSLYIVEENDPFIETHVRTLGIECVGKDAFAPYGEYSAEMIRAAVLGVEMRGEALDLPARPAVLCPGCPHRGTFYVLNKLKLYVSGDIGCYTLGAAAPLSAMHSTICMGASIGVAHGMATVDPELAKKSVAVIGDSTFLHSGVTGLMNAVYNGSAATVLILDNSITAMTGHQQNPATALTLKGEPAPAVDFEALARAVGVKRVRRADPFDLKGLEEAVREEIAVDEVSVIVVARPCALLKTVERKPSLTVSTDKCVKCGACMKLGCPALAMGETVRVDNTLCVGCGLCSGICPTGAIGGAENV